MDLDDLKKQNKKMGQDLQVLKEKAAQLHHRNVSYLQKIIQLEA